MYKVYKGLDLSKVKFELTRGTSGKYKYKYVCDDIFCFDTETTNSFIIDGEVVPFDYDNPSIFEDCEKHSLVYFWSFCINNDNVYIGRELDDFIAFMEDLNHFCPYYKIIYVHNLSFDFCFMMDIFKFDAVFARKTRHPLLAEVKKYVTEFRCSYYLTNLSLENWGKAYNLDVTKRVGDLDYTKIRTPLTPMTDKEIEYGVYDVLTQSKGLEFYKNKYGHICDIPLTHTGKMRREAEAIMKKERFYNKRVSGLIPETLDEYKEQVRAFIGGTVLCNWLYKDRVIKDLDAYDIASSYPFVLLTGLYPMTPFVEAYDNFEKYMNNDRHLYIITFVANNIESNYNCHFLSKSKAIETEDCEVDNGRIIRAKMVKYTLTSIDYELFRKCYTINGDFEIITLKWCRAGYLNDSFRRFILDLYGDKTSLKGVEGMSTIYQNKKEYINSAYGDYVTKIFADDIKFIYDEEDDDGLVWDKDKLCNESYNKKYDSVMKKQYRNYKAFIHGVFVTANARKRLWDAITYGDMDEHMAYTDTDSLKIKDYKGDFFEKENARVLELNKKIAEDLGVPYEKFLPKDKNGVEHPIGVWEKEDTYDEFKSLGCKQYIYKSKGKLHLTCAGISKLAVKCFSKVDDFEIDRKLTEKELRDCKDDEGHSAEKLIPYYSTNYKPVKYPDGYISHNKCGVCLMPTTFNLSMTSNDLYYLYTEVKEKLSSAMYS